MAIHWIYCYIMKMNQSKEIVFINASFICLYFNLNRKFFSMLSGVPKGENVQVDMDGKAGDLFSAEDAHPTGTGGTGVLSRHEPLSFYFSSHVNTLSILLLIIKWLLIINTSNIIGQHLNTFPYSTGC